MSIVSNVFTVTAALLLPVGAGIWLSLKKKGYLKPLLFGVMTFVVFQVLTRIPILQGVLPQMPWYIVMQTGYPLLYALFLGSTAALFEEGGRYLVMRLFLKNRQRVSDGIAFGIGHGGIEAVLLAGINALIILLAGSAIDPGMMFAGGVERISTMMLHVAWSVMVLKSVRENKISYLLLAFALHTFIDAAAVFLGQYYHLSILALEILAGAFALLMLGYTVYEYKKSKNEATV
jgi:uncharacterized membrane protein YhfC